MMDQIKKIGRFLGGGHILFIALPWLMVLTIIGTVMQKEIGLYESVTRYFHALITWFGPIPLPGGLVVLGLIFLSLLINFLFYSQWSWKKAGITLSHFGILLLLFGGIVTIATKKEGFMIIPEGQSSAAFSDYHRRVLMIGDTIFDFGMLNEGQTITHGDTTLKILLRCDHCGAQAPSGAYDNLKGLAENMELYALKPELNAEMNFSGLILFVIAPEKESGTYIVMEDIPKNPVIDGVDIRLTRARTDLPFSITLDDFRKIDYPGTAKAMGFESDLIVQDGALSWPVTIRMNQPLRYKGYSFYQSSFEQRPDGEVTVLSVVENSGRLFPYLSTLIVMIGLLYHCVIKIKERAAS